MIKIVWDADNGAAVPDGKVAAYVDRVIAEKLEEVLIGSDTLITEFRLRINKGQLKSEDVTLVVFGEVIDIDSKGHLKKWPHGFCDLLQHQMLAFYN